MSSLRERTLREEYEEAFKSGYEIIIEKAINAMLKLNVDAGYIANELGVPLERVLTAHQQIKVESNESILPKPNQ
ncbi:hypothetical protein J2I47_03135 [Fibrella sp. HMF5335]|uniref:Uncharacterized protein n=1 Tax=Fibrella rubiginis TaxID=2817060 RepID=A0A939GE28_9BACT|nr:hypothetical protein [Fibrella rubiginis]MBO0935534.1 hypothetical protein [Fibrella rubiginis]